MLNFLHRIYFSIITTIIIAQLLHRSLVLVDHILHFMHVFFQHSTGVIAHDTFGIQLKIEFMEFLQVPEVPPPFMLPHGKLVQVLRLLQAIMDVDFLPVFLDNLQVELV